MNPALQGDVFELYSDRKDRKFPEYKLEGPDLRLVADKTTPVLNFDQIKSLLLSKGNTRLDEYQKLITKEYRFLD